MRREACRNCKSKPAGPLCSIVPWLLMGGIVGRSLGSQRVTSAGSVAGSGRGHGARTELWHPHRARQRGPCGKQRRLGRGRRPAHHWRLGQRVQQRERPNPKSVHLPAHRHAVDVGGPRSAASMAAVRRVRHVRRQRPARAPVGPGRGQCRVDGGIHRASRAHGVRQRLGSGRKRQRLARGLVLDA